MRPATSAARDFAYDLKFLGFKFFVIADIHYMDELHLVVVLHLNWLKQKYNLRASVFQTSSFILGDTSNTWITARLTTGSFTGKNF